VGINWLNLDTVPSKHTHIRIPACKNIEWSPVSKTPNTYFLWSKLISFAGRKCLKPVTIQYLLPAHTQMTVGLAAGSAPALMAVPRSTLPTRLSDDPRAATLGLGGSRLFQSLPNMNDAGSAEDTDSSLMDYQQAKATSSCVVSMTCCLVFDLFILGWPFDRGMTLL